MNDQQIAELISRIYSKGAKCHYNPDEGKDGTLWIANTKEIEVLDLTLIRTYEFEIKEYFKYKLRDIM